MSYRLKYHKYFNYARLILLLDTRTLLNVAENHILDAQRFLDVLTGQRVQRTRYITVSCEPLGSGQLVSVMSSYVRGPDCLGREPNLPLCCR